MGAEDNLVASFHQACRTIEAACNCENNDKVINNIIYFLLIIYTRNMIASHGQKFGQAQCSLPLKCASLPQLFKQ